MSKCEHGLTSKECYVCASPKYGDAQQGEAEPLRLANAIDPMTRKSLDNLTCATAAAELRRLHEVEKQRDELLAALRDLVDAMTGRLDGETTALHNALIVIAKAEGKS